ncbi:tape measure protein [Cohnella cellulosilytica]
MQDFSAAKRARGSYEDMAGVIGRMGTLAGDAFRSNDELIAFSELMQKSFRVGGSGTMEQQAGMYQLSQAMAAGKLQGDEFRSIMENAPMLAQAIAKFTEKSKGELKQMSAEGTITADIIKGQCSRRRTISTVSLQQCPGRSGISGTKSRIPLYSRSDHLLRRSISLCKVKTLIDCSTDSRLDCKCLQVGHRGPFRLF